MRSHARFVLLGVAGIACAVASCLSFDALQGGANATDAGDETTSADDAGGDAIANSDSPSGSDAGSDGACPSGGGPGMVQIVDVTPPYCVDRTEVTNFQYSAFLQANVPTTGQPSPICDSNASYIPQDHSGNNLWPLPSSADAYPVANVDWCDATAFCKWAGKRLCGKIGGGSNLVSDHADPTKSQWYRACSQNGVRIYPYGSPYSPTDCNGRDLSDGGSSVPAGSLSTCIGGYPGLRDMAGNVEEWNDSCDDAGCLSLGGSFVDFGPSTVEMCSDDSQDDPPMSRSGDIGFRCCAY